MLKGEERGTLPPQTPPYGAQAQRDTPEKNPSYRLVQKA